MWLVFWNGNLTRGLLAAVLLVVVAAVTSVGFARVSRAAGALMIPSIAWAAAVTLLTGGLVVLN
jgi:tryptophan-rich sensory protein